MDKRLKKAEWGLSGQRVRTSAEYWKKPLKWDKEAAAAGERHRVFCASLADVFEQKTDQPEMEQWRDELFHLINQTTHLDWLLITKRPENILGMVSDIFGCHVIMESVEDMIISMQNLWIGTSVENQEQADIRAPELLEIPATVRFLSIEPMLDAVDISEYLYPHFAADDPRHFPRKNGIDWVIVGGESGPNARPMKVEWVRSIRDQCIGAGVPFFFKQWGEWFPTSQGRYNEHWLNCDFNDDVPRILNDGKTPMWKIGKKKAGRILDGRTWDEVPTITGQDE